MAGKAMRTSATYADDTSEPNRCHAKSHQSGARCRQPVVEGTMVCHYHGGSSPRGVASPQWRHGNYSKLGKAASLRERAEAALNDPTILSLLPNLAMVDGRIGELLEQMEDAGAAQAWEEAADIVAQYHAAPDGHKARAQLERLFQLIREGRNHTKLMREVWGLQRDRRQLVETEAKRARDDAQAITYDRAMGVVLLILDVMFKHVEDRTTRQGIMRDVDRLRLLPVNDPNGGSDDGGKVP